MTEYSLVEIKNLLAEGADEEVEDIISELDHKIEAWLEGEDWCNAEVMDCFYENDYSEYYDNHAQFMIGELEVEKKNIRDLIQEFKEKSSNKNSFSKIKQTLNPSNAT